MRQFILVILSFIVSHGFIPATFAQSNSSASASASANILTPVSIERTDPARLKIDKYSDLMQIKGNAGLIYRQKSAPVTLAEFIIQGEDLVSFTLDLPVGGLILVNRNSNATMAIKNIFNQARSDFNTKKQTFKVLADFDYNASHSPGNYVSPVPVHISVNYN